MRKRERELYKQAIEKWGAHLQIIMAFEEMSELTKELTKFSREKGNKNKIAEEIADVRIMLNQLEIMFDIGVEVSIKRVEKLKRLKGMLKWRQ